MLQAILILMFFQLLGEGVKSALEWNFPGSLFGMILMLAWLGVRGNAPENLNAVSSVLVGNLGLFFVPAGAGIISFGTVLVNDGTAIGVSLLASTCLAILTGGIVATALSRTRRTPVKVGSAQSECSGV